MLLMVIVGCEIAFWAFLIAGLTSRYVLRRRGLGAALLLGVPMIDLVLLVAGVVDLRHGGTAGFTHGLAAAAIGFSVAFGHSMIRFADQWFAHRFAGGPPPVRPPKYGMAKARHEWREFGKATVACLVTCGLLAAGILVVGDAGRTEALAAWIQRMLWVLGIWAIFPVAYTLWPARPGPDDGDTAGPDTGTDTGSARSRAKAGGASEAGSPAGALTDFRR